ncbi:MAG: hypothetical protein A3H32_04640 [Betaproteobacteria bacterium RIFCSPLOWO2_02_FULL_63_19]|nr:MAG: hypothetical protein A3H32_04640 [Betaproteobacteria bacterium RIFCSPLOWO2_02_FULL_63_19]
MNEATSIVKVRSLAAKPGKACFLALAAIVLIPPQQLAAAPFSNALQSVIDGAQQEGTLDLYAPSTLKPGRARALRQGIKGKYGIDPNVFYTGSGSMTRDVAQASRRAADTVRVGPVCEADAKVRETPGLQLRRPWVGNKYCFGRSFDR